MFDLKLLLDENLSFRLAKHLSAYFTEVMHVSTKSLSSRPDREIWQAAKLNNWVIVTNDSDFQFLSSVQGCPPKVVRINSGNKSTKEYARIIAIRAELIAQFSQGEDCYLEIVTDQ